MLKGYIMPKYSGPNDPNLPQVVKDEEDIYARGVFVSFNNSTFRVMSRNGIVEPELSDQSQQFGMEAMTTYAEGSLVVGGFNLGVT